MYLFYLRFYLISLCRILLRLDYYLLKENILHTYIFLYLQKQTFLCFKSCSFYFENFNKSGGVVYGFNVSEAYLLQKLQGKTKKGTVTVISKLTKTFETLYLSETTRKLKRTNKSMALVHTDTYPYLFENAVVFSFQWTVASTHTLFFFFIRILFFRPRLNILIFPPILGWKYSCIILKL